MAPVYDLVVARASQSARKASLNQITTLTSPKDNVLISGIGTGLDIPLLPANRQYTGIDITPSMLRIAKRRATNTIPITLELGDVMALPYQDECYDLVVMHLILAVVPRPQDALCEAIRVLKPGGHILILDKFLKPGQAAPVRRLINPLMKHIATQTNVVIEQLLEGHNELGLVKDEPGLLNGWFRNIILKKETT